MLALKQALSLVSTQALGGSWQPSDETGLEAWYKFNTGIRLNGSDVSAWADSSSNSFNMSQATASEQPAYNSGDINFTPADTQNLQLSGSDITLSSSFTIGMRLQPDAANVAVIGSNTQPNEFLKITTSTLIKFKTDSASIDITVNDGDLTSDIYLVVTRNSSNLVTLYVNGVAQTDTETLAGTADINAIGVRRTDNNPYDGTISEIQIYDTESTAITANVNTYLSNL
jgi:hypothetical protein